MHPSCLILIDNCRDTNLHYLNPNDLHPSCLILIDNWLSWCDINWCHPIIFWFILFVILSNFGALEAILSLQCHPIILHNSYFLLPVWSPRVLPTISIPSMRYMIILVTRYRKYHRMLMHVSSLIILIRNMTHITLNVKLIISHYFQQQKVSYFNIYTTHGWAYSI